MKIIFFGTPPFSAYILEKLHASINVVAVVCPPDREKGRGRKIIASAVKQKAEDMGIKIYWEHTVVDTDGYKRLNKISIMNLSDDDTSVIGKKININIKKNQIIKKSFIK